MAFSDDEIQSVVEQLSPGGTQRGYDALGVLKVSSSLSKIQRAAAGVLLLYPSVSYYYAYLAADALLGDARAAAAACAELSAAVGSLRRRSVPVSDVSAISNAKAALIELEGVVTSANPPKEMSSVPTSTGSCARLPATSARTTRSCTPRRSHGRESPPSSTR